MGQLFHKGAFSGEDPAAKANRKSLIASGISLLICFATLITAISYAWFASNRDTDASGMALTADTTANIVISNAIDSSSGIKASMNEMNKGAGDSPFHVTLTSNTRKLLPAMHDSGSKDTQLKYCADGSTVDPITGLSSGKNPSLYDVPAAGDSPYYIDYTVYIASVGKKLTKATLTAQFNLKTELTGMYKAASIDFYTRDFYTGDVKYRGTLNVAGLSLSNDTTYDASKTLTVSLLDDGGEIPCNTDGYITVTMRCYFDGALRSPSGNTYVTTSTVNTEMLTLAVKFTATGTEANA